MLILSSAAAAAATRASAAAIAVGQACVVNPDPDLGSPMTVNGTGFTPGDAINLQTTTGGAFGTAVADATGSFSVQMTGPPLLTAMPAVSSFVLEAMDASNAANSASTRFEVASLAVATKPALVGKPSTKVTWSFSGFTAGAQIYGHYLHGRTVTATVRFGRAHGPCGMLSKRALFYPGQPKYGTYTLQLDDVAHYHTTSRPQVIATLKTHIRL